ncbi:T9SS type A sorting domain-containing protein [Chryseobacterium vrystaatense]|uniref:T9SS type A sorting domain-containing protein n=1 Tax=Chryseobacterium vrystaatense TaxID=307480 RepID=UPI0006904C2E|nr:T9SS type A sorting domain-containing protein [Chryseobacterium vrystaatense]
MNKIYFFVLFIAHLSLSAQIINFPDPNFKAKLVSANQYNFVAQDLNGNMTVIDTNNDGEIQVSEALNISSISLNQTQIHDITGIQSFTNLNRLSIQGNHYIEEINVSNMTSLKMLGVINNGIDVINVQGCSQLENFNLTYNAGYITNMNFLQNSPVKRLIIRENDHLASVNISTLTSLEEIELSDNATFPNTVTSLDLSNNTHLKKIIIDKINLNSLTLGPLSELLQFSIENTKLTSLNLSNAPLLEYLYVKANPLLSSLNIQNTNSLDNLQLLNCPLITSVALQNKPSLRTLSLLQTNVSSLDFTGTSEMINMSIGGNALTSLDVSPVTGLRSFNFNENGITSLNLSQNTELEGASVSGTGINNINIKNGNPYLNLYVGSPTYSPNLAYVCCDTDKVQQFSNMLISNGHNNVEVNSYCSFISGGTTYAVQGNVKYDSDNNGCTANDLNKAFQQFTITDGINSGSYIGNGSGNYSISVQEGINLITPVVENPSYFSISPASITADFPAQASPLIQNFCLSANGTHPDLEVILVPINNARPGFTSLYKIVYKNKGTTTQSGTLVFHYNDTLTDYLSSTTVPTSQSAGVLNWGFTNLLPFETKEITVSVKLNTPTQTPPLNGGEVLQYMAQINGTTDETPLDNQFTLNQTVVNSFDPNDKTCLEGTSITQVQVGDYVHYLIRFENKGTANAQNIVVKDEIDISKFDIASIVPLTGSHNFTTRISNPNVIEFIFENIQLPFDDANNDGYISFKIKTKATLTLGDSFSNTAKIYFDYNHPIVTNTFTTTVKNVLATSEVTTENNLITIYPNPVKDILNIKSKNTVIKAEIYDVNGRIISSTSITGGSLNVSDLAKGNYIIKLFNKDKTMIQKFIKN